MKNIFKVLGIIAIVAIIWLSMACGGGDNSSPPPVVPIITTWSLPNGTKGTEYSQTLTAEGDTPISWSIGTGTLPIGLNLATTGIFSGKPTTIGTFEFTVIATNKAGNDSKVFSIVIEPSWTEVSNSTFGESSIGAIAYGNGKFVAVGMNGKMATSTDGTTWTAVKWPDDETSISSIGYNYKDNYFFLSANKLHGTKTILATSTDGTSWYKNKTITSGIAVNFSINSFAYGNDIFVVSGSSRNKLFATFLQDDWDLYDNYNTSVFNDVTHIYKIVYGNGKFVAVCNKGKIAYSTDGKTWTAAKKSTFSWRPIFEIAYGNGKFVAVGGRGKIAYLLDN